MIFRSLIINDFPESNTISTCKSGCHIGVEWYIFSLEKSATYAHLSASESLSARLEVFLKNPHAHSPAIQAISKGTCIRKFIMRVSNMPTIHLELYFHYYMHHTTVIIYFDCSILHIIGEIW
jgi:hypothetical protein